MALLQKNSAIKHRNTANLAHKLIEKSYLSFVILLSSLLHHIKPKATYMIHVTSPTCASILPKKIEFNGVSQKATLIL